MLLCIVDGFLTVVEDVVCCVEGFLQGFGGDETADCSYPREFGADTITDEGSLESADIWSFLVQISAVSWVLDDFVYAHLAFFEHTE